MALVVASADQLAAEIAAGVLIFFLLVFIFYAHNNYLRALNAGFIVLLGGLLALNICTTFHALRFVTLFLGVMSCLFSVYDIWDDLISRRVNESDASVFAKMTHTSSRCWGVIWGLVALVSLVAAVYFHLLVAQDDGDALTSISDASTGTKVALGCAVGIVALSVAHTAFTRRCTLTDWLTDRWMEEALTAAVIDRHAAEARGRVLHRVRRPGRSKIRVYMRGGSTPHRVFITDYQVETLDHHETPPVLAVRVHYGPARSTKGSQPVVLIHSPLPPSIRRGSHHERWRRLTAGCRWSCAGSCRTAACCSCCCSCARATARA
jgi:hypothetical protein